MAMSDKMTELLNSIGALAEMSGIMREQLIKNGFTRQEALIIVGGMISSLIASPKPNKEQEDDG